MQFLILTAGKPSLGYAKEGVELYLNRLRPFGKTEPASAPFKVIDTSGLP